MGDSVSGGELREPVLIAWSDPEHVDGLAGNVAGRGGSVAVGEGSEQRYVTGQVALDGPDLADHSEEERFAVVLHELGHLVGLGHVDDPAELMHPSGGDMTGWGPGDRYGLSALGSAGCD
jgi:hypothetical protein